MGFFSKIKKIFGTSPTPAPETQAAGEQDVLQKEAQEEAQPAAEQQTQPESSEGSTEAAGPAAAAEEAAPAGEPATAEETAEPAEAEEASAEASAETVAAEAQPEAVEAAEEQAEEIVDLTMVAAEPAGPEGAAETQAAEADAAPAGEPVAAEEQAEEIVDLTMAAAEPASQEEAAEPETDTASLEEPVAAEEAEVQPEAAGSAEEPAPADDPWANFLPAEESATPVQEESTVEEGAAESPDESAEPAGPAGPEADAVAEQVTEEQPAAEPAKAQEPAQAAQVESAAAPEVEETAEAASEPEPVAEPVQAAEAADDPWANFRSFEEPATFVQEKSTAAEAVESPVEAPRPAGPEAGAAAEQVAEEQPAAEPARAHDAGQAAQIESAAAPEAEETAEAASEQEPVAEPAQAAEAVEPAFDPWANFRPAEEPATPAQEESAEPAADKAPAAGETEPAVPAADAEPAQSGEAEKGEPEAEAAPADAQPEDEGELIIDLGVPLMPEDWEENRKPAVEEKPAAAIADYPELTVRLREAEAKLSVWLDIVLDGVIHSGEELNNRVLFLLRTLEAPADEAKAFVDDFAGWLERMDYTHIEDFRSELQYRLALALDLEDEEDERNRLFLKLSDSLAKTRAQFARHFDGLISSHGELDDDFWEELEEIFIMADLGVDASMELTRRLRTRAREQGVTTSDGARALLQEEIRAIFARPRHIVGITPPEVVLMIGVNGAGKTTTIAKLAYRDRMQGKKVMIAAADTFRAAAIEQLQVWAGRVGALFHAKQAGSDPASVAYEAMDRAIAEKVDVLYVDTAGRLQTKVNLMDELSKIRNVIARKHPGAPHRTVLVLDATTGQNALSQARLFKESAGVDELILTKLDGTAKGGVAIAVAMQHQLPITYVGLGEKVEDLRPFNGDDYAEALLKI